MACYARVRRPKHTDVRDDAAFLPGSTGWGDGVDVPNCEARPVQGAKKWMRERDYDESKISAFDEGWDVV